MLSFLIKNKTTLAIAVIGPMVVYILIHLCDFQIIQYKKLLYRWLILIFENKYKQEELISLLLTLITTILLLLPALMVLSAYLIYLHYKLHKSEKRLNQAVGEIIQMAKEMRNGK